MKSRRTNDLIKALFKKGFVQINSKHKHFVLMVNDELSEVKTIISHGNKEYSDSLMQSVKRQMKLDNNSDVDNFFDCPLDKDGYVKLLINSGKIKV